MILYISTGRLTKGMVVSRVCVTRWLWYIYGKTPSHVANFHYERHCFHSCSNNKFVALKLQILTNSLQLKSEIDDENTNSQESIFQ